MTIEHVSEGRGAHSIQKGYLDSKRKLDSAKSEGQEKSSPGADQVEISKDAKRLSQRDSLIQELRTSLESMPEVREERVRAVEERVTADHYERREVLERLADALLEGSEDLESPGAKASDESPDNTDVRLEKIEQVQTRIAQGYYDREDIIETLVQILLG